MNPLEKRQSPERKKHPADMLRNVLREQSQIANEEARGAGIEGDLLSADGALDPKGYVEFYGKDVITADANFVRERERHFSGATIPSVEAFYKEKYGVRTEEEHINIWRENKSREKNGQMEMAVTALLSQKLGRDFLVVRTAPYDDYKNGVDTLILDRVTGEVIGAFDEVHEGGDGKRSEEKRAKVEAIAKKGGARIRYGLKLSGNDLVRASLENIPVFYLGLSSAELVDLEQGLADHDSHKTDAVYATLLDSLSSQYAELTKMPNGPMFSARLSSFGETLRRLAAR